MLMGIFVRFNLLTPTLVLHPNTPSQDTDHTGTIAFNEVR